jgi:alpha-tubulin suppressor-like RCC1 family protein
VLTPTTAPPSDTTTPSTPLPSPLGLAITAISAGDFHTCALTSGGGVKCWGANDVGQLGNGSTTDSSTPVAVSDLARGVTAISAGGKHTCALTIAGGVKCWGWNLFGELGNGTTTDSDVPLDVAGLVSGVTAIAAGGSGTCALTSGGAVKCWGMGGWGQLGNATAAGSNVPIDVTGLETGISAIAAGGWHTCALTRGGSVMCWGTGAYWPDCGESPCATDPNDTAVPVVVAGLPSGVSAIAAGGHHTCVLTTGGGVTCWGGALYNGSYVNGTGNEAGTPGEVVGLSSGVIAIAAGDQHTCALTSGGGVKCWGYNHGGVLGDGTTSWSLSPVDVAGLASGVSAIAAGYSDTCALMAAGGVKCWGANWRGQLGNGSANEGSLVPVDVDFAPASSTLP